MDCLCARDSVIAVDKNYVAFIECGLVVITHIVRSIASVKVIILQSIQLVLLRIMLMLLSTMIEHLRILSYHCS